MNVSRCYKLTGLRLVMEYRQRHLARRLDGGPAAVADTVQPTVTVNNQPVNVLWQKANGKWTGLLDKSALEGPWVVRACVRACVAEAQGRKPAPDKLEVSPKTQSTEMYAHQ